ncbi:MAG TPA: hypothetical protein PK867_17690 [Pirellulales bacterium]|nr:hypothetical protein [Pirellulales bacterium]
MIEEAGVPFDGTRRGSFRSTKEAKIVALEKIVAKGGSRGST